MHYIQPYLHRALADFCTASLVDCVPFLDWNIPAMIYYPIPLHLQKAFLQIARQGGELETSEKLSQTVLSLPMHTELDLEQQNYIIEKIRHFYKS